MDRSERRTLERVEKTLPTFFYLDPDHHRRELVAIWYASWVYACRSEELARSRDFRRIELGDQSILVTRNDEGQLRAFHNTCRHRGSILCSESEGRFPGSAIVCPYHQWTYSLDGALRATPRRLDSEDFRLEDYPLYRVAVAEWAGFVFLNLAADPPPLDAALDSAPERLANWQLEDLRVGFRTRTTIECNWKIFWENFSECLHCASWHPELTRIVPTYGKGIVSELELPEAERIAGAGAEEPEAPLAPGAETWTLDGRSRLPALPGLTEAEKRAGQTFGTVEPSFFVIAHRDYARSAQIRPLAVDRTEVSMEWLFPPAVLEREDFDLDHSTALARRVVEQDARACELNQRGLSALPHESGVLVKQEHWVREFQLWVRARLGEAD